jgi:carbon storage regulator
VILLPALKCTFRVQVSTGLTIPAISGSESAQVPLRHLLGDFPRMVGTDHPRRPELEVLGTARQNWLIFDVALLVLSRKHGEAIVIGDGITVTVLAVEGGRVKLGVVASPEVPIRREEIGEAFRPPAWEFAECA